MFKNRWWRLALALALAASTGSANATFIFGATANVTCSLPAVPG
jgi:hypothetical protein